MPAFEVMEHTADIGVRAFGATAEEAFQNAAVGMFSLITELDQVEDTNGYTIAVEAEDRETLLVEWLNELLYLYESREVLLKRFEVSRLLATSLEAVAYGEPVDRERHTLNTDIKAATYYMLKVTETASGWITEVIFDV
jgi:SHS2 domain-containing protein